MRSIPLKTGFCQAKFHDKCLFLIVNGSKAPTRYLICSCECHYNDPKTTAFLVEKLKNWGVEDPEDNTYEAMLKYVDTINVIAAPKYEDTEE